MANQWTKEQKLCIDKQNANILVAASAGSGKTAVLVERVVKKVLQSRVDIDRLLVVTFTNASAIELKERLLQAIYQKLEEQPKDAFLKRQLSLLNRASITTIHSFCLDLIRSHFQVLGLDPNIQICDETQSYILKNQAIDLVLEEQYLAYASGEQKEEVGLYQVLELFSGKEENLKDNLLRMYAYIQSFAYPFEWLAKSISMYTEPQVADLKETAYGKQMIEEATSTIEMVLARAKDLREEIAGLEAFEKYIILMDEEIQMLEKIITHSREWDSWYEMLCNIKFKNAPRYFGNQIELKEKISHFRSDILKVEVKKIQESIYDTTEEIQKDNENAYRYLKYLYELLLQLDTQFYQLKQKKNYIDFSDIEHMALEILIDSQEEKTPSKIAMQLQEKFVEVYTDEYQDISFVQEAILQAVSGGKNRFMVGDMKQSIYQFRQAMPEIFNEKYEAYPTLEKEEEELSCCRILLDKNFRSRENVLASINYIFERIMSKEVGECSYSDIESLKVGATFDKPLTADESATEICIVDVKSEEEEEESEVSIYLKERKDFEIESMMIANKIQQLVGKFPVFDTKRKETRPARYQDIVILMKNMKHRGNVLETILKERGIPAFSDAVSSLFEGDEVRLVLSFLRVLDNPLQDIYMVSVMYSIIGNFTLEELAKIRKENKGCSLYDAICQTKLVLEALAKKTSTEEVLQKKLTAFLSLLENFREYATMYRVSELLTRLYKETDIYYQFALGKQSRINKANLDLLVELATKNQTGIASTLQGYITYIDRLKDKTDASTSAAKMIGENEDVVRIMTIHKSKGLEFPIVILCDTNRKYNMRDFTSPIALHHHLGVGINIVHDQYPVSYPSVIKQAIKNQGQKEIKSEELRVLYVALTRAKEKLIIFGTVRDYEKWQKKQFVMEKGGKIVPNIVANNTSYLENIVMALHAYLPQEGTACMKLSTIAVHDQAVQKTLLEDPNIGVLEGQENSCLQERIERVSQRMDIAENKKIQQSYQEIKQRLSFVYPYQEEIGTKDRISVSALKAEHSDFKKDTEASLEISNRFVMPTCLVEKEEAYTPVRKGTLIHFILENLDMKRTYTKESLQCYLEELVKKQIILEQDIAYLSVVKLFTFLNSTIGKQLQEAVRIYKEQEFILQDERYSKSMIQGVIDLFYENKEGNMVLVDFKTDQVRDVSLLKSRYALQLEIYKRAIEKLMGKKVERVYLYSFYLEQPILLKEEEMQNELLC